MTNELIYKPKFLANSALDRKPFSLFVRSLLVGFALLSFVACSSSEQQLEQGRALMKQAKFRDAIKPLNAAIDADADNYQAFNARGVAYFELKEYANALLDYEQAIKLRPDFYLPYYNRALLKTAQNDSDAALKDYSQAISMAPDSNASEVYLNRGELFAKLGNLSSAMTDFDKAVQLDSTNSLAYFNRGNIRFQQEEYPPALNDFTKAVQLDSRFGKAFNALGVTQMMMNQKEVGCLSLKQAQRLGYADAEVYLKQYCQ